MALLNPPDAVPEAMRFLLRALLARPNASWTRADLLALVAPEGLVEAMTTIGAGVDTEETDDGDDLKTGGEVIAARSLDALGRLSFVQVDGTTISLTAKVSERWHRPEEVTAPAFSVAIREALFEVADPATEGSEEGVMDLVRGLALLVNAPDPLFVFDGFDQKSAKRRFVDHQRAYFGEVPTGWPVVNRERWVAFRRFAVYLQLAQAVGSSGLIADSSGALRTVFRGLPAGRLDVADFVERCARLLPIFEGGFLHLPRKDSDQTNLSPGLSLSLRQLEADGLIRLDSQGDAPGRVVALGSAPGSRKDVTHILWTGKWGKP